MTIIRDPQPPPIYDGPPEPDATAEAIGWQDIGARESALARQLFDDPRRTDEVIRLQRASADSYFEARWWMGLE